MRFDGRFSSKSALQFLSEVWICSQKSFYISLGASISSGDERRALAMLTILACHDRGAFLLKQQVAGWEASFVKAMEFAYDEARPEAIVFSHYAISFRFGIFDF